jgi:NAD(P)-dependent dehydrogenase (short-subunit alcohol dehydrogenase family)
VNAMGRFEGRVALIGGGGSGLGRAAALRVASEGAAIVVADINPAGARETCRQVRAQDGRALFVLVDVTCATGADRMTAEAVQAFRRLDVLFTAAGVGGGGTVVDISEDASDRLVDLDLKGVYLSSRFAIPEVRKAGCGAIIHVSSIGGLRGHWGAQPSAQPKAGSSV